MIRAKLIYKIGDYFGSSHEGDVEALLELISKAGYALVPVKEIEEARKRCAECKKILEAIEAGGNG